MKWARNKGLVLLLISFLISGLLAGCSSPATEAPSKDVVKAQAPVEPTEITISAAASLKDAIEAIKPLYESKNNQVKLVMNYGSSGTLQQQIEQGSPVDVFISAGKKQMDALEEKNLISKDSRKDLLGNELVLIVGKDNTTISGFPDLTQAQVKHIGIGNAESVPAGKYATETLTSMKLYDVLKPKFVEAKDVRQVLSFVETGNAEAGFVYESDTKVSDKIRIAAIAPADTHKPIVYPAAIIADSKNSALAKDFLDYLGSDEAMQLFIQYGFKQINK